MVTDATNPDTFAGLKPDVQHNFSRWSPAVGVEKGDGGPGELVVRGDEKSSPGERAPANPVDDSTHKTAKELHVSKGVDVPAKIR